MSEAELIDRYIDALKRNPKAAQPLGLDADTADFVRALVLSEQVKTPGKHLQERVWHKALTQAESGTEEFISRPASSNGSTQNVIRSKPNGRFHFEDAMNHAIPLEPAIRVTPGTRPPQARYVFQYTATIAAMLLILVLVGGVLIQMAKTPNSGYLAVQLLDTATPIIEPTPVCNASSDYMTQGEASISKGDYAAALTAYNCAIEIDSTNLAAYLLRGGLAAAFGDYDQLGYDYYTFIVPTVVRYTDPTLKPILNILPTLKSAIEARPDDTVLYLLRGLVATSFIWDAPIDMIRLMDDAPDNPVGYLFNRNYLHPYNPDDALLQKAIELAPDSALLDLYLSRGLSEQNAAFAKPFFDRAIQSNPEHPFAYMARGLTEVYLGDMDAAARDFFQHSQINPDAVSRVNEPIIGQDFTLVMGVNEAAYVSFTAQKWQKLSVTFSGNESGRFPATVVMLNPDGEVMTVPYRIVNTADPTAIEGLDISEQGVYTLLVKSNSDAKLKILISETQ